MGSDHEQGLKRDGHMLKEGSSVMILANFECIERGLMDIHSPCCQSLYGQVVAMW